MSSTCRKSYSGQGLKDVGCIRICEELISDHKVAHLDLTGNDIRADGAAAIGRLLARNSALRSLNLEWNMVGVRGGVITIASALKANRSLKELDLRNNRIAPDGATLLGEMLRYNNTLTHLDLRWNELGTVGGQAIVDALKYNESLIECKISGSRLSWELEAAVEELVERNKRLAAEKATKLDEDVEQEHIDEKSIDKITVLELAVEAAEKRSRELETTLGHTTLQLERALALHQNEAQARSEEVTGAAIERQAHGEQMAQIKARNERLETRISILSQDLDGAQQARIKLEEEVADLNRKASKAHTESEIRFQTQRERTQALELTAESLKTQMQEERARHQQQMIEQHETRAALQASLVENQRNHDADVHKFSSEALETKREHDRVVLEMRANSDRELRSVNAELTRVNTTCGNLQEQVIYV